MESRSERPELSAISDYYIMGKSKVYDLVRRLKQRLNASLQKKIVNMDVSYSQCGEDRIIAFLCGNMGIARPTYLDVGANDPIKLSNTYLFYRFGCRGVCVEPNPLLHDKFLITRPNDVCLNLGVGPETQGSMPFYQFGAEASGLSTFSRTHADENSRFYSHVVERTIQVPVKSINSILDEYFDSPPDLLSIDVEGLDLDILKSVNFEVHRPKIICAETILHSDGGSVKDEALINFLLSVGYFVYGDTYVNSIFVNAENFRRFSPSKSEPFKQVEDSLRHFSARSGARVRSKSTRHRSSR